MPAVHIPVNFYWLRKASGTCQNQYKAEPWRKQTGIALVWERLRDGIRPQHLESVKSGASCRESSAINSNIWQDVVFDPFCNGLWKTLWKCILGNTRSFPKNTCDLRDTLGETEGMQQGKTGKVIPFSFTWTATGCWNCVHSMNN